MQLYKHQEDALALSEGLERVAYYHDMGLGKTFTGAEQLHRYGKPINLVICQKSKINDWSEHFKKYYQMYEVLDLTNKKEWDYFLKSYPFGHRSVMIINYELAYRRPDLKKLCNFTLMLDESSLIQNEKAKRTKFILSLKPKNVILLSGTPCNGKYENLYSQAQLLGWDISKTAYWRHYIESETVKQAGHYFRVVTGYKNVERLKDKLREHGAQFLKTAEVFDLPSQIFNKISVPVTKDYQKFIKTSLLIKDDVEFIGDNSLKALLYERQLCGSYNPNKLEAVRDLLESTDDRLIIFYNFDAELRALEDMCIELDRPVSIVNGKEKDLSCYEEYDNSVSLIQYQAGSMGLNLQKANKIIYFTPTLSSELFEQSKKRTNRIGQVNTCHYYMLTCKDSIEEKIYQALEVKKDYTNALYIQER